ncbi:OmpA family protein [Desulfoluna sp.]|uniref:OmpA family protein n=1 Tax=Desulfoluna sp. TaxID=2045199 RepID=UPI002621FD2D|nr:OmpA family protein [Desulfoluna sp.]
MRSAILFLTITLFCFSATVFADTSKSEAVRYYPGTTSLIPIGTEEYLKNYSSLAGIEGVYVILDYVEGSSKKNGITMRDDLKFQIKQRLNDVGLKLLTKEEMQTTPGQPEIAVYPGYSGGTIGLTGQALEEAEMLSDDEHCCRNNVWMSFMQSASILRRPDSQFKLGTWGSGSDSNWCQNRGEWMYDAILKIIDKFVEDYKKAEAEKKPINVASRDEVPSNCAQAWSVHMQVFDTNSTKPNSVFLPILDRMIAQAKRCSNYSYLIETHADVRADDQYNQLLTEARAASIKEYLMSCGIAYNRLKSKAYGESKPLTTGTTEADHAANRRVVITPLLTGTVSPSAE